jgi:hypothetical protein
MMKVLGVTHQMVSLYCGKRLAKSGKVLATDDGTTTIKRKTGGRLVK